jgi:hypothetical protein
MMRRMAKTTKYFTTLRQQVGWRRIEQPSPDGERECQVVHDGSATKL